MNVCPIPPTKYNANNTNNVNFSGIKEQNTGGFLPAASSLLLPGLGQYMNNDGSKGVFYMLSYAGISVASALAAAFSTKTLLNHFKTTAEKLPEVVEKYIKSTAKNKKALPTGAKIADIAVAAAAILLPTLRLLSFVDAYKGKTSADIKQVPVAVPVPVYVGAPEVAKVPAGEGCDCGDC